MKRRHRVAVLDLVTKAPNPGLYGRVMNANDAGRHAANRGVVVLASGTT